MPIESTTPSSAAPLDRLSLTAEAVRENVAPQGCNWCCCTCFSAED